MNRTFLAVAVLLIGSVVSLRADYVIIKVNLAVTNERNQDLQDAAAANPAQTGPIGGGPEGPEAGGVGPGAGGAQRGGGLPGGGLGGAQRGGGLPGGGLGGAQRGGGLPGGGLGGMQMGQGRGGQGRGGAEGMGTMGPGANITNIQSGAAAEAEDPDSAPLEVTAIVEVEHADFKKNTATGGGHLKCKLGEVYLPWNDVDLKWGTLSIPTVANRYKVKQKEAQADVDKLVDLAQWALAHGLLDEVPKIMEKLTQVAPKHPAVVAFQKVQADMARPINVDDAAVSWKDRLGDYTAKHDRHYTLIYFPDAANERDAQERLALLEQNHRGFFYWFALQGKPLTVPNQRLVAVLVPNPGEFEAKRKEIFDDAPMAADGFFVRRDNLAVFSAKRLDDGYAALQKVVGQYWTRIPASDLLQGKGKKRGPQFLMYNNEVARAQTLTLISKAMEHESALSTVGHEGTRQLIAAVGLLPRSIEAPRWIDDGMASFFETPKESYWAGTGGVSQYFYRRFKYLDSTGKLKQASFSPVQILKRVITDRDFHEVREGKTRNSDLLKARTRAWALVYYLARNKVDGMLRYYEELSNMPRDLEFGDEVLEGCFARSFGLVDPANPGKVDVGKMTKFANEWYLYMRRLVSEVDEIVANKYTKGTTKPDTDYKP